MWSAAVSLPCARPFQQGYKQQQQSKTKTPAIHPQTLSLPDELLLLGRG